MSVTRQHPAADYGPVKADLVYFTELYYRLVRDGYMTSGDPAATEYADHLVHLKTASQRIATLGIEVSDILRDL